ncbi:MAG: hypothetical protein JEZ11_07890 [Desulfobacterales bacterium]|nr:hypothetical protein [Desulfobacterales bacterium]
MFLLSSSLNAGDAGSRPGKDEDWGPPKTIYVFDATCAGTSNSDRAPNSLSLGKGCEYEIGQNSSLGSFPAFGCGEIQYMEAEKEKGCIYTISHGGPTATFPA